MVHEWNALGLGTPQMWKKPLIYNQRVEGVKTFGAKEFQFRRRMFPFHPGPEWFAVDLFNNRSLMAVTFEELFMRLLKMVDLGRFSANALADAFLQWGTKDDAAAVLKALRPKLQATG